MPTDAVFLRRLREAIENRGGRTVEFPTGEAPNPFRLSFALNGRLHRALVHVRRTTLQQGVGTDHHRPPGEWHTQMIFDQSKRGAGVRNLLESIPGYATVLLGYAQVQNDMVLIGWDAERKREYAYSRSLQVKDDILRDAIEGGVGLQEVRGGEVVVAFRPEFFPEYLSEYGTFHDAEIGAEAGGLLSPGPIRRESRRAGNARGRLPPPDYFGPRDRRPAGGTRAVRDVRFKAFISDHYTECAVCGIAVPAILEAAHIIPVADERSSDHPSNGLCLCRNCHGLYDAALLKIRPDYSLKVTDKFRRIAASDAAAYDAESRRNLRLPDLDPQYLPDAEKLRYRYDLRG
jgi:hypothetical protein